MDNQDLRLLKLEMTVQLLQRLVLRHSLAIPPLSPQSSNHVAAAHRGLSSWLAENAEEGLASFGRTTRDPAMTALLAEELRAVVEAMQTIADEEAADLKKEAEKRS